MDLIELNNITMSYDKTIVLQGASLTISSDSFIGVIGPNGGGKTTFIRCLMRLITPVQGEVNYLINNLKVGYLPQQSTIDKDFPIDVFDTVCSGSLQPKYKLRVRALELIEEMGLSHLNHRSIVSLSGGELQRVLLARALIQNPQLLVLDEPTTYIDSHFENEFYQILAKLNTTMGIIMVSHDLGMITRHAKTIACINRSFHYHLSNKINKEQLNNYNCPIEIITHKII